MFERRKINNPWEGRIEPFEIIKNVYFTGTFQASCHLIDTGAGLILIDPGYANTLYLVVDSIYKLGYKPADITYIINTHWHGDHTASTKALCSLTGAKTFIGKDDKEKVLKYFTPDFLLSDGDTVSLGNTEIHIIETPGHTKGCISFYFDTVDNGKTYRVGMFGGAGANTLVKDKFDYPDAREGYRNSLNRLRKEKIDVFIGNHVWNNDTEAKGKLLLETGENKFIDDKLFYEFLDFCEKRLDERIKMDN